MAKKETRTGEARAVAYLTPTLKRQAEKAATEMGISVSSLIALALGEYLKRRKT